MRFTSIFSLAIFYFIVVNNFNDSVNLKVISYSNCICCDSQKVNFYRKKNENARLKVIKSQKKMEINHQLLVDDEKKTTITTTKVIKQMQVDIISKCFGKIEKKT